MPKRPKPAEDGYTLAEARQAKVFAATDRYLASTPQSAESRAAAERLRRSLGAGEVEFSGRMVGR